MTPAASLATPAAPARSPRAAFQGERGAYSEDAAAALLGASAETVPRPTFAALFEAVADGEADYAVAPVENSLVGAIGEVHDLLSESRLVVRAEALITVRHCLIGPPGATEAAVRSVESHPAALAQCALYFASRPDVRAVPGDDTAAGVRRVVGRGDVTAAAVASRRAAEIYGGVVLREGIEDRAENYTRFWLLAAGDGTDEDADSARDVEPTRSANAPRNVDAARGADTLSLVFEPRRGPKALWAALEPFARRGVDVLRIESRPAPGPPWRRRYFLDLRADADGPEARAALEEHRSRVSGVRVLGWYASAVSRGRGVGTKGSYES